MTLEEYKALRRQGYSKDEAISLSQRGRTASALQPKETFREKGLVRTAGEFLGMKEFGAGIGQSIANATGVQDDLISTQEQGADIQTKMLAAIREKRARGEDTFNLERALQKLGGDLQASGQQTTDIGTQGLTDSQVLGSAAQTGLSVIGLRGGLPTAKTLGMASKPILGGAAAGALSGAAFGAAGGITEGTGAVPGALKGAALGGAVGGAVGGVSKFVNSLASKSPKTALGGMSNELKTVRDAFNKGARYQNVNGQRQLVSDPITTLTEKKLIPKVVEGKISAGDTRQTLARMIGDLDDETVSLVDDAVARSKPVSLTDFQAAAEKAIRSDENLQAAGAVEKTVKQLRTIFNDYKTSYGKELPLSTINKIRVRMNKVYTPDDFDVARAVGDAAREFVYKGAPGTQQILSQEGKLIAADKFLKALDGKAVRGGKLGRYFYDLIGAMAGSSTDIPIVGPLVGAVGMRQVSNAMQRQALDPVAGRAARTILSVVDKLPTDTAGKVSKTAVLNLIARLSSQ